ncbi:MAG TPA: hypothetical protein H9731_05710 [Candidatus Borkfalkia excrementipullorum]|nr:hypothetical protein [Candidatus Borkfalkia excrementipullorum]
MNDSAGSPKKKLRFGKLPEIIAVAVFILVIAALLLFSFRSEDNTAAGESVDYIAVLEEKLSKTLSQMEGAGNVEVVINARSEGELVLAMETTVNEDGSVTTKPVLVNGEVVVLEEKFPEITGVLIVSEGANDLGVRFSLLEAAASVLNINQSIIKVYTKGG